MKFANPYFLFALLALAIPIIIHLFNFRKFKRVYFTNVRFLREVKQDTKARNKLKNLLILASRLLAVLFLVLAFAQPYFPKDNGTVRAGDKVISIYIDNSFSMEAAGKNGSLLDEAKKDAREIVAAYKASDRFHLVTNDFEGRHQRLLSRDEFLDLLEEVKPSSAVRKISEVVSRQQDMLNSEKNIASGNKQAFLISDYQQSISDFKSVKADTSILFRPLHISAQNRNNIYIDSVWFENPVRVLNKAEKMFIRVRSKSDQDMENVPMRLYINGEAKTPASFSIAANSYTDTAIFFTIREPGLQQGIIEINDYPINFDDRFYFSFEVLKSIPVLAIEEKKTTAPNTFTETDYLKTLFGNDSAFTYTAVEAAQVDYSTLSSYRFIVLNSIKNISSGMATELRKFVAAGGSLMLFPAPDADLQSYKDFLNPMNIGAFVKADTAKSIVDQLNFEHTIYNGVFERKSGNLDLPVAYDHFIPENVTRTSREVLMKLRNGDVFMASHRFEKGSVYTCVVPLTEKWSNFPRHALFVPTLYQAALFSQPMNSLFYTIGQNDDFEIPDVQPSGDKVFHILSPKRNFDIIPGHSIMDGRTYLNVRGQISEPDNFVVKLGNDQVAGVSFNYDRRESDMNMLSKDELEKNIEEAGLTHFIPVDAGADNLTAVLTQLDFGVKLWKYCVWLMLLFLLAEVLIIRFWKTTPPVSTPRTE
ncbi:MAG: BatA and WFA domain-containing protein [Bacteroidia bacterium]